MRYFIKTFGCQMNKADSEKLAGWVVGRGGKLVSHLALAQVVIINTCSVRQSAEDRVIGLVKNIVKLRKKKKIKILLTGCMLRYSLARLKQMLPEVDQFCWLSDLVGDNDLVKREDRVHAWVTIMEGCDNFCSYCVVPYARGREKSRPIEEIYCQVNKLVKRGHREITLLGQNVNSYYKNSEFKIKDGKLKLLVEKLKIKYQNNFAVLLALLCQIEGLEKIKFITSNPHDLTDGIIKAMKLGKVDRYLHLAVQSGDDQILKKMNRKYTVGQYLKLIKKIRREIPEIKIGTDIIVGFPGETKKQFLNTVFLCQKAKFSQAYISKYSPRPGTLAYQLKDDVPILEKKLRWRKLNQLINKKNKK